MQLMRAFPPCHVCAALLLLGEAGDILAINDSQGKLFSVWFDRCYCKQCKTKYESNKL